MKPIDPEQPSPDPAACSAGIAVLCTSLAKSLDPVAANLRSYRDGLAGASRRDADVLLLHLESLTASFRDGFAGLPAHLTPDQAGPILAACETDLHAASRYVVEAARFCVRSGYSAADFGIGLSSKEPNG